MATYRLGSSGEEVHRIQERLRALNLYRGPLDGDFGGGTEAAVKAFQAQNRLKVDGQVGPITWRSLFSQDIPTPDIAAQPLDYRCLALTGSIETGAAAPDCFAGLSGDFDGQGISFGVLQWNFGQNSLQPLLNDLLAQYPAMMAGIFHEHLPVLAAALQSDQAELMNFAASIQHPVKHTINEPWRGMFKALGRTAECQEIQRKYAAKLFQAAHKLAADYGLQSPRAVALMFDIKVQNGSISDLTKARILADFSRLAPDLPLNEAEVEKMKIVAQRRAEAANPRWIEDVRARKLCIAKGHGVVHGVHYDLAEQFGIGLET
jgi:hypothetical protein